MDPSIRAGWRKSRRKKTRKKSRWEKKVTKLMETSRNAAAPRMSGRAGDALLRPECGQGAAWPWWQPPAVVPRRRGGGRGTAGLDVAATRRRFKEAGEAGASRLRFHQSPERMRDEEGVVGITSGSKQGGSVAGRLDPWLRTGPRPEVHPAAAGSS
jgi:hypothetical protein